MEHHSVQYQTFEPVVVRYVHGGHTYGIETSYVPTPNGIWVDFEPLCERLALRFDGQIHKLVKAPWARLWWVPVRKPSGTSRPHFVPAIDKDTILGWAGSFEDQESRDHARNMVSCILVELLGAPDEPELDRRIALTMHAELLQRGGRPRKSRPRPDV